MKSLLFTAIFLLLASPVHVALAQGAEYVPIVGVPLPGGQNGGSLTPEQFVEAIYVLAVSLAALLAVLKIIYGGVQYMLTDVVTSKEKAKKDIWGAIFGLLIVLSAVLILEIINPQLKTIRLLQVSELNIDARQSAVTPTQRTQRTTPQAAARQAGAGDQNCRGVSQQRSDDTGC